LPLCKILRRLERFDVTREAGEGRSGAGARAFASAVLCALVGLLLAGCGSLPKINGTPLPPEPADEHPVYRDLADIPDAPKVTPTENNQNTIQDLAEDRAKAEQAAQNLRREPFDQPDPAMSPGF
jgi:hypothetical protein